MLLHNIEHDMYVHCLHVTREYLIKISQASLLAHICKCQVKIELYCSYVCR